MSPPDPISPPDRSGLRALATAMLPSLLAVVAVTALVTGLFVWRGQDVTPRHAGSAAPRAVPTLTPPASAPPPSRSVPVPARRTPAPSHTGRSFPPPPPRRRATVRRPDVVVLNATRRTGLAARVARRLRARGWNVVVTANFRGAVPATTVYYPAGGAASARVVSGVLPASARVRPRFGNLSTARLTVVLGNDYPT